MTPRRNHDPVDFVPHGPVLAATLVVVFLLCLLAAKAAAFTPAFYHLVFE